MALVEAMCCGIPAVGYKNCPAVNELIQDGVNGILCDEGVIPLAEALKKMIKNPSLRQRYGEDAKIMAKKYHANIVWKQWEELLGKIVRK